MPVACVASLGTSARWKAPRHKAYKHSAGSCHRRAAVSAQAHPALDQDVLFAGIDFGTSGARVVVIDGNGAAQADIRSGYTSGDSQEAAWESALFYLLQSLPKDVKGRVKSLAIDGTSATTILLDKETGDLLAAAKLYNEGQPAPTVARAKAMAPPEHTATASTSTLCKLLAWDEEGRWQQAAAEGRSPIISHQADWLAALLHGQQAVTDYNNCLKLGYDPAEECYPDWLADKDFASLLPTTVCAPGTPIASLTPEAVKRTGLPQSCIVCAGTTDSIAAFLAAGVDLPGQAVTSLGSTLAIKLLSEQRVDDARYGIYSHRLGSSWLVGGASNTGGAVLRKYFSDAQLELLSRQMDPATPTGLDYYPLVKPGERFPINDPELQPRMEPQPQEDARFLQGIFEGIAAIEARAYSLLAELGATPVREVFTAGGGNRNAAWSAIRQRMLGVPVFSSPNAEAAYGAALLARQGYQLAEPAADPELVM